MAVAAFQSGKWYKQLQKPQQKEDNDKKSHKIRKPEWMTSKRLTSSKEKQAFSRWIQTLLKL